MDRRVAVARAAYTRAKRLRLWRVIAITIIPAIIVLLLYVRAHGQPRPIEEDYQHVIIIEEQEPSFIEANDFNHHPVAGELNRAAGRDDPTLAQRRGRLRGETAGTAADGSDAAAGGTRVGGSTSKGPSSSGAGAPTRSNPQRTPSSSNKTSTAKSPPSKAPSSSPNKASPAGNKPKTGGSQGAAVKGTGGNSGSSNSKGAKQPAVAPADGRQACPKLDKKLLAAHAENGIVLVTVGGWQLWSVYGINWVSHVTRAEITNAIIIATDKDTSYAAAQHRQLPCFSYYQSIEESDEQGPDMEDGNEQDPRYSWRRVTVVRALLEMGYSVIYSDMDAVWVRSPFHFFAKGPAAAADVAFAANVHGSSRATAAGGAKAGAMAGKPKSGDLEVASAAWREVDTGVFFARATAGGRSFVSDWSKLELTADSETDRQGLVKLIRDLSSSATAPTAAKTAPLPLHPDMLSLRKGEVVMAVLSSHVIMNDYAWFVERAHAAHPHQRLAVHFPLHKLSQDSKLHLLREAMLYADGPGYYDIPLLMSVDIDYLEAPRDFSTQKDTAAMVNFHIKAMHHQLQQLFSALAVATMLGRTLILPELRCYCYNGHASGGVAQDRCRAANDSSSQLPFPCSLDQFLDADHLFNTPVPFGDAPLRVREHSFTKNPRFPGKLRSQRTVVHVGKPKCGVCVEKISTAGGGDSKAQELLLPSSLRDNQLRDLLQPYARARWLHFTDAVGQLLGSFQVAVHKSDYLEWLEDLSIPWAGQEQSDTAGVKLRIRPP